MVVVLRGVDLFRVVFRMFKGKEGKFLGEFIGKGVVKCIWFFEFFLFEREGFGLGRVGRIKDRVVIEGFFF